MGDNREYWKLIWSGQYSSLDMGLGATSDFSDEGRNPGFYAKGPGDIF